MSVDSYGQPPPDPLNPPEGCTTLWVLSGSSGLGRRMATCQTFKGAQALAAAELEVWRTYVAEEDEDDYPPLVDRLEWVEGEQTFGPSKYGTGRPKWTAQVEGDHHLTITAEVGYP